MTPERRVSANLGEVMLDVLHAHELQACNIEALTANVDRIATSVERLAEAVARRPTKRQTLGLVGKVTVFALVLIAGVLVLIWSDLRDGQDYIQDQVEMGGSRMAEIICGLEADARSYHATDPLPPGCPTP